MIHRFNTLLLDDDGNYLTQTVNGEKNILIDADKQYYRMDEILKIVDSAYYTSRERFGWTVKFNDVQNKKIFLRTEHIKNCNDTTKQDQTIQEWLEYLYDVNPKQINLF